MSVDATGALEAIERVLNRGGDADDVLRSVVAILHERGFDWAGIVFAEEGERVLGPEAGERPAAAPAGVAVSFQGVEVAELLVSPRRGDAAEEAFLARVATLVSAHCLVGWDTGGVAWDELGG